MRIYFIVKNIFPFETNPCNYIVEGLSTLGNFSGRTTHTRNGKTK